MALLATLTDAFPGSSLSANWTPSGTVAVSGGECSILADVDFDSGIASAAFYTVTNSYALVKVTVPANSEGYTYFQVTDGGGALAGMACSNYTGEIFGYYNNTGTEVDGTPITYDATAMAWWRIRAAPGTIYCDYSSDGLTWTNFYSTTSATVDLSSVQAVIAAGALSGSSGTLYIAEFNVTPVVPWSFLQSFKGQASGAGTVTTAAPGSNLTSGSKLIAWIQVLNTTVNTSVTVTGVSDSNSNAFTRLRNAGAGGYLQDYPDGGGWSNYYVYALDTPAGDAGTKPTVTVTLSGSGAAARVLVQEVSGLAAGMPALDGIPADATGSNFWSSSDYSAVMPYYVTSASNEYLAMMYADGTFGGLTWTAPSGWTADSNSVNSDATYGNLAVAYKSSTGGLESASWAVAAGGNTSNWGLIVIAFRLAGNGVTVNPPSTIAYQSSSLTTTPQVFGYADPQITNVTTGAWTPSSAVPTINQNVFGSIAGETQSMTAYSPHNWTVTANINDSNGLSSDVKCYPNVGWYYDGVLWQNAWSQWYTGWNVSMPEANDENVLSACYDLWPNTGTVNTINYMNEVMLHFSLINRGGGTYQYQDVQFGGYTVAGQWIPVTYWGVLTGGQTVYFNQMDGYGNLRSSSTGWVSLYEVWAWLCTHTNSDTGGTFLLPGTAVGVSTGFSAGFEFCNTGGVNETAAYNDFWCYVVPAPSGHAGASRRGRR